MYGAGAMHGRVHKGAFESTRSLLDRLIMEKYTSAHPEYRRRMPNKITMSSMYVTSDCCKKYNKNTKGNFAFSGIPSQKICSQKSRHRKRSLIFDQLVGAFCVTFVAPVLPIVGATVAPGAEAAWFADCCLAVVSLACAKAMATEADTASKIFAIRSIAHSIRRSVWIII
jgi:hypothetical protein